MSVVSKIKKMIEETENKFEQNKIMINQSAEVMQTLSAENEQLKGRRQALLESIEIIENADGVDAPTPVNKTH